MLQVIQENQNGMILQSTALPTIFNVYILRGRSFKDSTFEWKLGIESARNPNKYFIFDSIRGTKDNAIQKMCELMNDQVSLSGQEKL